MASWMFGGGDDDGGERRHACALKPAPTRYSHPPTRSMLRKTWDAAAACLLPCDWHHASKTLLRSSKAMQDEIQRQVSPRCWFVVHPYSSFKFYWDCSYMLAFVVSSMYMPFQVFYPCPNPYDALVLFSDGVTFLSIILHFFTGRVDSDDKKVTLQRRVIARRYLQGTFVCDLLACLPLQCIPLGYDCTLPSHTAFYIFKLLRIFTARKAWANLANQVELSYEVSVTSTVFMYGLIFIHWMTYAHYQIPALCALLEESSQPGLRSQELQQWLDRVKAAPAGGVWAHTGALDRYTANLYFVSGFCIGASVYSSIKQHSLYLPEQILVSVMALLGLFFMIYSFTTMLRLVIYRHLETYLHNGRLKEVQEYFIFRRLPKYLHQKMQLYINYRYNGHYFNERSIRNTINVQIKQEINMFCCKKLVINVPLFQNMPIGVINTIIFSLTQVLFMPGEILVKYGTPGASIYLIASGTVAIMNAEGREVGHLKDGAFFGERALLKPGTLQNATIIALEITEVYKLSNEQLQACLPPTPRARRRSDSPAASPPHVREVTRPPPSPSGPPRGAPRPPRDVSPSPRPRSVVDSDHKEHYKV